MWAALDVVARVVMVGALVIIAGHAFGVFPVRRRLRPVDITSAPARLGRCEACKVPTAFRFCLECACGVCGGYSRALVCGRCRRD